MRRLRGIASLTAAVFAALAAVPPGVGAAAGARNINYVALGDSYASGVGTRQYFEESGDCLRSPKAYPQLWANSHKVTRFAFDACSGAVTGDVNAKQLGSLDARTTLVTISVGGNDVGFSSVLIKCLSSSDTDCDKAVGDGETKARDELPSKLDTTYATIKDAAPNARILVVGYPRINDTGSDCGIPYYSATKRERINKGADVLDEVIAERAKAAGLTFADPRDAFEGHGVCSEAEWINGPSNPIRESFHPNADGHAKGYLPMMDAVTG